MYVVDPVRPSSRSTRVLGATNTRLPVTTSGTSRSDVSREVVSRAITFLVRRA